jgi:hypothetical protein
MRSCPYVSAHMSRACCIPEQKKRMELEKSLLEAQAPNTLSAMFDLEHGGACPAPTPLNLRWSRQPTGGTPN